MKSYGIIQLVRNVIYCDRSQNSNQLIDVKAKELPPQRAAKGAIDKVLPERKYAQQIVDEDPNYKLDLEPLQTRLPWVKNRHYSVEWRSHINAPRMRDRSRSRRGGEEERRPQEQKPEGSKKGIQVSKGRGRLGG